MLTVTHLYVSGRLLVQVTIYLVVCNLRANAEITRTVAIFLQNILDVFMNVGKSLVGSCTFSARLKHSRPRNAVDSHQFDLGLTITGFQMMDTIELRSPPLNNIPSGLLVRRAANSELIKMFSSPEGAERDG